LWEKGGQYRYTTWHDRTCAAHLTGNSGLKRVSRLRLTWSGIPLADQSQTLQRTNFILLSAPTRQALSRTYGRLFAEFLNEDSPVRLGVLHQPTCVGFRYGWLVNKVRRFSGKRALPDLPRITPEYFRGAWNLPTSRDHRRIFLPIFLTPQASNPIMRPAYCAPSRHRITSQCRNINLLSIACGFHHRLRPD